MPPVAVAFIHQEKGVAFDDIGLAFYGCSKAVEGIDEVEVDRLIGDGKRGRAIIIVHVVEVSVLAIGVVLKNGMLLIGGVGMVHVHLVLHQVVGHGCSGIERALGLLESRDEGREV